MPGSGTIKQATGSGSVGKKMLHILTAIVERCCFQCCSSNQTPVTSNKKNAKIKVWTLHDGQTSLWQQDWWHLLMSLSAVTPHSVCNKSRTLPKVMAIKWPNGISQKNSQAIKNYPESRSEITSLGQNDESWPLTDVLLGCSLSLSGQPTVS